MLYIVIAVILFLSSVVSTYFSFYSYYAPDKSNVLFMTFLIIGIICLLVGTVFVFLFINKKNQANLKDMNTRLKKWRDISYHASKAGDEVFNELPIAILLYDGSYLVSWANQYAKNIFENTLNDIPLKNLSKDLLSCAESQIENTTINFSGKSYDVIHNAKNKILYLFDVSEREKIKKRYDERISCIGIIEIDNLEESLKRYDMQEKTNLRGQILGEVSDWIAVYKCYLQSSSEDKMIILFDKDALKKMIADTFSILSNVREISQKNRLKTSISMGIACFDVGFDELGSIAQNALELAERRGGDQVVVNLQGEKIKFFGGNTNSLEKNTLVEARMQAMSIKDAVEGSSNVLIMCHNFADCDAIGSMMAVYHMVSKSNVDVKMVFDPKRADVTVNKIYGIISANPDIVKNFVSLEEAMSLLKSTTLLIVTDTQSPSLVMFKELFDKAKRLSIIDHHRAGDDGYKDYLSYYVESSASSTVELVSEMFSFYDPTISFTSIEASIMLAGIIVDTNNFTMRSGTRTFEAAATLKSMGADMTFVRRLLQESLEGEKVLAEALTRAEIYGGRFGIICLDDQKIVEDRTILAKISDKQLTIAGVEAGFTIGRLDQQTVGISARSLGDDINVQTIMEQLGGGGHFNSAATQLKNLNVAELNQQLREILRLEYVEGGSGQMKVILNADVKGKGKKDEIIDVPNGYGNYLITNNLAVQATQDNIKLLEDRILKEKQDALNRRNLLKKIRDEIDGKSIVIKIKIGNGGKVFGSITTKLVCDEFEAQHHMHLDKKKVELPGDINSIGIYTATVKLDTDIVASFEINVEEKN